MKKLIRLLAGAMFMMAASDLHATPLELEMPAPPGGTPVPAFVTRWVRLADAGEENHPVPTIWFATQRFHRSLNEWLITLTPREYGVLLAHIHSYVCTASVADRDQFDVLEVREFDAGHEHVACEMVKQDSCAFLISLSKTFKTQWSTPRFQMVRYTEGEMCG